jgi:hypothetical protein
MSEYVEARYVKIVLQEARSAEPNVAAKLIYDLLRDLSSLQRLSEAARADLDIDTIARAKSCSSINSCPRVGHRKQSH